MGEEWERDPRFTEGQPEQDEIDKRLEDIKRKLTQGASEAQSRLKKVVGKANDYWQKQSTPAPVQKPQQATSVEEHRLRQLVNNWSNENWRVARDLGTYMEIGAWSNDEVWELTLETRWETRALEITSEPYTGISVGLPRPLLPVWDYELEPVTGLKAPLTRTRLKGMEEIVACTNCNSTGHVLCSNCTGRGWIVCPDCKGRTKMRCSNCRGRGYIADWPQTKEKKSPFIQRQAQNVASSLGNKVSDVFEGIRQQGVPIPNPVDTDPATKGPTIPCPECVNGEVACTCGNGKRVCPTCQGARMSLCGNCGGTGKMVRHREIVRRFDLRTQTHFLGDCPIPPQQLGKSAGDLLYSAEVDETFYAEAAPENVPVDIWRSTVELVRVESQSQEKPGIDPQSRPRPTLQVVELVRIPYTSVQYRYSGQEYVLYIYDSEGKEKFFAERFPARWDRVERLFKAISNDLITTPTSAGSAAQDQLDNPPDTPGYGGYRASSSTSPYSISEEDDGDTTTERR